MDQGTICVFGGTGFVGGQIVAELTRRRVATVVPTRRRERHRELLVNPSCSVAEIDVTDDAALAGIMRGCDAVLNLVGILNQHGGTHENFEAVHAVLPRRIAEAAVAAGVPRMVHMSSLGAGTDAPSEYLRTKGRGEDAVHAVDGLAVTSLRPSVIFGPGDSFFNRFATLLKMSPLVLPLACPESRMAPVYIGDVVAAFCGALGDDGTVAQRLDLCGPREYTLRELVEYTARISGVKRMVIGLGDGLSRLQAAVLEHVPGTPFTRDNYLSLQVDSVCHGVNGLERLGIDPTAVETIVPSYLGDRGHRELYQDLRSHASRQEQRARH